MCLDSVCGGEGGDLLPHHRIYYPGGGERRVGANGNGWWTYDSGYGYVSFLFFCLFEERKGGDESGNGNWNGCTGYDSFFSDPFLLSFSTYLSSIASSMD